MKFLDNPVVARKMKASDVLDVENFNDKYEFVEGTTLCADVLVDYFKSLDEMEKKLSLDVDLCVDSLVVAHEANLTNTMLVGVSYLGGNEFWSRRASL